MTARDGAETRRRRHCARRVADEVVQGVTGPFTCDNSRRTILSTDPAQRGPLRAPGKRLMTTHSFTLVIEGDAGTDDRINALFEAGCDDATVSHGPLLSYADFDREAPSRLEAIMSAIEAVESVEGRR